ncbi:MAG TPA: ABC transporter ATP-binding protein [Actinomycetes bacterium]|nr:ABC transporter ATP-binding protein [Actinomycetes bacterium]
MPPDQPQPRSAGAEPLAVQVDGLVKRYGERAAVDHLDLTARMGAVTAVLGPNGAGKTTTVEVCEGLRRADAGTVRVLGLPADNPELRFRVGVMLQDGGVYGTVNPREALNHAAALYRWPQSPTALLETFGLDDVASTPSRRLSGGQRQRLGLALAIVGRPEVVFLDEPTSGLDPHSRRSVWDLITALRDAGVGVILTTHYLEEAEHLADHVVIVDQGRAIAAGPPAELVAGAQPTSRSARSRLQFTAVPALDVADLAERLPEGSGVRETSPGAYEVVTPGLADALTMVTAWFTARGVTPTSIHSERRTLEDVFLELTTTEDNHS